MAFLADENSRCHANTSRNLVLALAATTNSRADCLFSPIRSPILNRVHTKKRKHRLGKTHHNAHNRRDGRRNET